MSKVGITLIALVWSTAIVLLLITVFQVISWLLFVYCFSYIKLFITLVKYFPQVSLSKSISLLKEILVFIQIAYEMVGVSVLMSLRVGVISHGSHLFVFDGTRLWIKNAFVSVGQYWLTSLV